MKKFIVNNFIFFGLLLGAFRISGWGFYTGLWHNKTTNHTVGAIGDCHFYFNATPVEIAQENTFKNIFIPYLAQLITNQIPKSSFIFESNMETVYEQYKRWSENKQIPPSLAMLLFMVSYPLIELQKSGISLFTTQDFLSTYPHFKNALGITGNQNITLINADNRIGAIAQLQSILMIHLFTAAKKTLTSFNFKAPQQFKVNLAPLLWIDNLCFDTKYQQALIKLGMPQKSLETVQSLFWKDLINLTRIEDPYNTLYTTQDVISACTNTIEQLTTVWDYFESTGNTGGLNLIASKLGKSLENAQSTFEKLKKQYPQTPLLLDTLKNFAFDVRSFYDLTPEYIETITDPDLENALTVQFGKNNYELLHDFHKAFLFLLTDYEEISVLAAIIQESKLGKNCFLYQGKKHIHSLGKYLQKIGYEQIYHEENENCTPLNAEQIKKLYDLYKEYSLQKTN